MRILIKYVFKSMWEKKLRSLLVIFAIAVSVSLFYSSLSVKNSLSDIYTKRIRQQVGNADITVQTKDSSSSKYIDYKLADKLNEKLSYAIHEVNGVCSYEINSKKYDTLSLKGINLSDYKKMNDFLLVSQKNVKPFKGNKIIISSTTAKAYNLKSGSTMNIKINGTTYKFEIVGIAAQEGIFLDESIQRYAIIPFDSLSNYFKTDGKANELYIKSNGRESKEKLISKLKSIYPKYEVKEPFTQEQLNENLSTITISLIFITIIASFMSIFIIYSSFKIIMINKLPHIGTFRSVGATKKSVNKVMLMESMVFGIIGGVLAGVVGIGITYALTLFSTSSELQGMVKVNISYMNLLISFILANVISFISSIIPIMNVSNIPIKEVVLNNISEHKESSNKKGIIGIVLVIISAILPKFVPVKFVEIGSLISVVCIFVGILYAFPLLFKALIKVLKTPFSLLFGSIGKISIGNMRNNKSILNITTLIVIGVGVLLMVNTLCKNMTVQLIDSIANIQTYDIGISFPNLNKSDVETIKKDSNVKDVLGLNCVQNVKVKNSKDSISLIDGVSGDKYFNYRKINLVGNKEALLKKLKSGRNIIVSKILQKRYDLSMNSKLSLELNGKKRNYTVIGFADTYMTQGSFAMISVRYLQKDTGDYNYVAAYIHVRDNVKVSKVNDKLKKTYKDYYPNIEVTSTFKENFKNSMQQLSMMIEGFSIISIIVGCFGIINNFVISFIERKHSIAVYRSIGMKKKQVMKMIFVEALIIGLTSGAVGVLVGIILINIIPMFLEIAKVAMPISYFPKDFIIYVIGAVLISMLASIGSARNVLKMNIVQEIKSE
ncbi:FtsX-like permease family protein [Clostridium acetobutylicum]|uniref:Predicted permease n=1 Tax=Clostridium acetobutylicum (strain ATCC 824 / DSM 792 / JCM 1419 / IAM 19013 / LMG 5710 / NBRC 13948 / NRRL B-527 / VKM B-1787 / 2291 / W) TaxID=272562 RepID=Q97HK8_CLOAB|nr:FtsX-like permease family protein [Clostridium acetobutylicum]AAK79962.1 Predicted permease [Clostridium acetobutylicum ATCC 824]